MVPRRLSRRRLRDDFHELSGQRHRETEAPLTSRRPTIDRSQDRSLQIGLSQKPLSDNLVTPRKLTTLTKSTTARNERTYSGCFILTLKKLEMDLEHLEYLREGLKEEHPEFTDFVLAVKNKEHYETLQTTKQSFDQLVSSGQKVKEPRPSHRGTDSKTSRSSNSKSTCSRQSKLNRSGSATWAL